MRATISTLPSAEDRTGRDLGDAELSLLRDVIESGRLGGAGGVHVKALEHAFAARHWVPFCRALSSGSAAMHCAVAAVAPEPGDEIITSPLNDREQLAPILYQRAIPVFADVDPLSLNLTAQSVGERIGARTRAIIVTHMFGSPADIFAIHALALARGIPVIEDCGQAPTATQNGRWVGTIGEIGTFSLRQDMHITCGEGGIAITNEPRFGTRMRNLCAGPNTGGGNTPEQGMPFFSYRMTELQAAVACAQLRKLDAVVDRRRRSAARLTAALRGVEGITTPSVAPAATHVFWKYVLNVDPQQVPGGADALALRLEAGGIPCAPLLGRKTAFEDRHFTDRSEYPGTMRGLQQTLLIDWNEFYTDEQGDSIADAIRTGVDAARGR